MEMQLNLGHWNTDEIMYIPEDQMKIEQWGTNELLDEVKELIPLINKKFKYRVNLYSITYGSRNTDVLGIAPQGSNIMTALVAWDRSHERYEIKSPRIQKEKHTDTRVFSGWSNSNVVVTKNKSKLLSILLHLYAYEDDEVYAAAVSGSRYKAEEMCGATSKALTEMNEKWNYRISREEKLELLNAIKRSVKEHMPITLASDSKLMENFNDHMSQEQSLKEKLDYVGVLCPVYLVKLFNNDSITLLYENKADEAVYKLVFDNVELLPDEVKDKLYTLNTVLLEQREGKADGVGARYSPKGCEQTCFVTVSEECLTELAKSSERVNCAIEVW